MSDDVKWIGYDKLKPIVSKFAAEIHIPLELLKLWKPGAFKFNDGTTQGWTIDQFYDTNDPKMIIIPPYTDPKTQHFYGFSLSNHQNLALAAGAYPYLAIGTKATSLDFYLESPDLLSNQDWKNINGYSLDLNRRLLSPCGDPPAYYVQLQVRMWDKQKKKMRTFAEWDDKANTFIFHAIEASKPYNLIWTSKQFADPNLVLRFLRIRFTQPNFTTPGSGECLPKGAWLIGNISPEA